MDIHNNYLRSIFLSYGLQIHFTTCNFLSKWRPSNTWDNIGVSTQNTEKRHFFDEFEKSKVNWNQMESNEVK